MRFDRLETHLRADVLSLANKEAFLQMKDTHPALSQFESLEVLVTRLEDRQLPSYEEKETVTRAFLELHQAQPSPLWSKLLLWAYYPMLLALAARIIAPTMSRDDVRSTVIESFLTVILELPLRECPNRLAMYLRQATSRRVFRLLGAQTREQILREEVCENGVLEDAYRRLLSAPTSDESVDEKRMMALLDKVLEDEDLIPGFRFWVATVVDGESPSECVDALFPDLSPKERRRIWENLKRKRTRAIATIQKRLSTMLLSNSQKPASTFSGRKRFLPDEGKSSPEREAGGKPNRSTTRKRSKRDE